MATGNVRDLLAEIAKAMEMTRIGESPDVVAVQSLVGAMGQSFTTTLFAFQQVSALKSDVGFLMSLCRQHEEPWVRTVSSMLLARPVKTLRTRYALNMTADLHVKAAAAAAGAAPSELLQMLRGLFEYYNFLVRGIRDLLPFHELSVVFEGHKRLTRPTT